MTCIVIIVLLQMLILSKGFGGCCTTRSLVLSAAVRRRTLRNMSSSPQSHLVVVLSPTLSSQLNDPSLLTDWDPSITDKTQFFHVNNPAATSSSTQQTSLARVPSLHDIVPETLVTSHRALETQWRDATTAAHRASLLTAWSRLMLQPGILHDLAVFSDYGIGQALGRKSGRSPICGQFLGLLCRRSDAIHEYRGRIFSSNAIYTRDP
jgi:hypothetical protein